MSKVEQLARTVLGLYREGLFPMADEAGEIRVHTADPRAILPLEDFHVPRRMLRELRQAAFDIRINADFPGVIRGCARRSTTWISPQIVEIYEILHRRGYAHSVEAWRAGRLAGGLYGVALGGAFCGESMFFEESGASKAATVALVERLRARGFALLDCQMVTANTQRFGARYIPKAEYLARLADALKLECRFVD